MDNQNQKNHPLKCEDCDNFRRIDYLDKIISENEKSLTITNTPYYKCDNCGAQNCIISDKELESIKQKHFPNLEQANIEIDIKDLSSVLNSENKFSWFDNLEFDYDPRDYYTIPLLYRPENDGYLTPVFFDKDVLLYYNNHPDYKVKLSSFSSGNIYFHDQPLFAWGFGINRSGKIFKWLGDLSEDFKDKNMKSHLKRFQASNIESDHDIYSKFYLSQNPFSFKDAFQDSDNENKIFKLQDNLNKLFKEKFEFDYSKLVVSSFNQIYKHPILNERNQIFEAYLSLYKVLIEGIEIKALKNKLVQNGIERRTFNGFGSLKTFSLFIETVLKYEDTYNLMTPFFILYEFRNLHGHLNDTSFKSEYEDCIKSLHLPTNESDFVIYERLIEKIIGVFEILIEVTSSLVVSKEKKK